MSEPILATDAERDTALALLREASVDGRLTVEDLAERAELVHAARTREDLAAATSGLERAPAPPAGDIDRQRALLSSVRREGRWRLAPRSRFSAVLGSVTLDLRQAVLPGPDVEIDVQAILGSVTVVVPEGVEVDVSGMGILSSEDLRVEGTAPAGAPRIRIRHSGLMGSLSVSSRLGLTDEIKAQLRRHL
ncbi:MAG TPA: DUF1707 domain-containing protein [Solirubrobacteraceae bacterium]|nr:DUF1707 domain-containing protein [Solirubrobacteraceae bacterium]